MARVTVEDCEKYVENRFDLVLLASCRARQIFAGVPTLVESADDKNTVIALREIAEGLVNETTLSKALDVAEQNLDDDTSFEIEDTDNIVLNTDTMIFGNSIEITDSVADSTPPMFEDVEENIND